MNPSHHLREISRLALAAGQSDIAFLLDTQIPRVAQMESDLLDLERLADETIAEREAEGEAFVAARNTAARSGVLVELFDARQPQPQPQPVLVGFGG